MHYYNEFDPKAAAWLRELMAAGLIPKGVVDERSITEVQPADLVGYVQCHFFAGIGGWSYALRLAGWPEDRHVWTGSCPCQPFSSAGKQKAQSDDRHLWPAFFELIRGYNAISQREPVTVFGEQVESAIRHGWLDGVCSDLEGEGYTVGHAVLGAHSVGSPHIRQRLYWVGVANSGRWPKGWPTPKAARYRSATESTGSFSGLGESFQSRLEGLSGHGDNSDKSGRIGTGTTGSVATAGPVGGLAHARHGTTGTEQRNELQERDSRAGEPSPWDDYYLIPCRDGKARRVKSGLRVLAHGVPGRVGLLRGYGNAIVPEVAAEFVQAYLETTTET